MTKKTILIIIIIIFITMTAFFGTWLFLDRKNQKIIIRNQIDSQDSIGALLKQESTESVNEGQAINSLLKALPYSTADFTITKYDYARAKFIITSGSPDIDKIFKSWLENSEFKAISLKRFLLTNSSN